MSSIGKITKKIGNRFLNFYELEAVSRDGRSFPYYMVSRNGDPDNLKAVTHHNNPDGVILFGVYGEEKDKLVLVRQYRYPIQQVTLEIPAGKLDAEGEEPLDCARRELSEETGYQAEKYTFLTKLATTVGFSNEFIYIYAAEGLTAGRQHPDEDEFINVCTLTMDEAMAKIRSGEICDAKSVTAVLLLRDLQDLQGR